MKNPFKNDDKVMSTTRFYEPMTEIKLIQLEASHGTIMGSLAEIKDDLKIVKTMAYETKNTVDIIKSNYATRDYVLGKILAVIGIVITTIIGTSAVIIAVLK